MKALVFHGAGSIDWEEVPDARLVEPTDAVVRIDTTTICGTDLHILHGDVPTVTEGRILGHEGVGTVVSVGDGVRSHVPGDRVIISCISGCGVCSYCRSQNPSHCLAPEGTSGIGWILGHLIDGTQAELVRVPFADSSLHDLPPGVPDELAVLLSDILPTGFEIGVRYGHVQPGDTVAVVGAGPVGLAAVATAGLYGAAQVVVIDRDQNRLDCGEAARCHAQRRLRRPTGRSRCSRRRTGPASMSPSSAWASQDVHMCTELVRPGGTSRTSAFTASESSWTCRTCGSGTSTSPRGS